MYTCSKCGMKNDILKEAMIHEESCFTKKNYMVFSNYRVPAYKRCRRVRKDNQYLKNLLLISHLHVQGKYIGKYTDKYTYYS